MTIVAAVASCAPKKQVLVLYYSQTGTTQAVAEEIQRRLGADIERIDVVDAYDGSYEQTIARCQKEMSEGTLPPLKPLGVSLYGYDTIFLGYPIWFGTCALPVLSLLDSEDLSGKIIVPFCTFGSGGLGASSEDVREAEPDADVREGYGVRTARLGAAPKEIERFLVLNGYLDGEVEIYEDYSAQEPVTPEEAEIFSQACSGYKYPLGKPVSVGSRKTSEGTDYKFTAVSSGEGGRASELTIFVTVPDGGVAEFTQVVR